MRNPKLVFYILHELVEHNLTKEQLLESPIVKHELESSKMDINLCLLGMVFRSLIRYEQRKGENKKREYHYMITTMGMSWMSLYINMQTEAYKNLMPKLDEQKEDAAVPASDTASDN